MQRTSSNPDQDVLDFFSIYICFMIRSAVLIILIADKHTGLIFSLTLAAVQFFSNIIAVGTGFRKFYLPIHLAIVSAVSFFQLNSMDLHIFREGFASAGIESLSLIVAALIIGAIEFGLVLLSRIIGRFVFLR